MKLLSQQREAAPGNLRGGVSLSDKEQLSVDSEVFQFIPLSRQGSPQALQWRGGRDIIKASQERDVPTAPGFPILACSRCWGKKQEREGAGARLLSGEGCCVPSDRPFHTEAG